MRLTRIFLDTPLKIGLEIELDTQAHHHLVNVLRLKSGARLIVFNGCGGEYQATLTCLKRRSSRITVNRFLDCHRESKLATRLLQGISRNDSMDYALQKAVELGVCEIQPIATELCAIKLQASRVRNKYRHWKQVIVAACEQSGRTSIPNLLPPLALAEVLEHCNDHFGIVLDPRMGGNLASLNLPAQQAVSILIGPEGGFTSTEIAMITQGGFTPVRMGPRTLRTETASVVALAALQVLWGDLVKETN